MNEPAPPRVISLRVRNYRALRDITFKNMTPLTVLLGPNGSGKSTVFDVFAFLSECCSDGIRKAWDRRGRFQELRSRDCTGPLVIELRASNCAQMDGVSAFMDAGAQLGELWMEGHFPVGDPLAIQ